MFASVTCPVLLLQADMDPNQPAYYYDGYEKVFPNAASVELRWITDSGHFSALEQPGQVAAVIKAFCGK